MRVVFAMIASFFTISFIGCSSAQERAAEQSSIAEQVSIYKKGLRGEPRVKVPEVPVCSQTTHADCQKYYNKIVAELDSELLQKQKDLQELGGIKLQGDPSITVGLSQKHNDMVMELTEYIHIRQRQRQAAHDLARYHANHGKVAQLPSEKPTLDGAEVAETQEHRNNETGDLSESS